MYDSLEEAFGKYASYQIDAISGIETVKAHVGRAAAAGLDARRSSGRSRPASSGRSSSSSPTRAASSCSGSSRSRLFLVVGSAQVMHGTLTVGEFVAFNSLVALANGPVLLLLLLWDELQFARILLGRLDDVIDQEPEQGADRSAPAARRDARRRDRARRRRLPLRRPAGAADPRRDHRSTSSRARRSRSSGAAARARRRSSSCSPGCSSRPTARSATTASTSSTLDYRDAAPPHRLRPAGELPLRRHDRRATSPSARSEPDTRPRGLGRARRQRPRVRRPAPARLRDAGRRVRPRGSPAGSGSGSRSPARSTTARRSCSSTRPPARSTASPSGRSRRSMDELFEGRTSFVIAHRLSHDPRRRPHPRPRPRPPRRGRHARRAAGPPGPLLLPREPAAGALKSISCRRRAAPRRRRRRSARGRSARPSRPRRPRWRNA